ncbi:hypothetical protein [Extensimonas sp. H3M7-6]|uniref:hypothetical protein n=1 Tax=Extensimonas soli TaxID=3031322 RepID=UPI0023D9A872|nr:hypothetical protein [Extensimonas sp. H3M7-6]MDF1482972.1 hypothetical protein [Extensimonas sp. H3M7-6]
MQRQLRLSALLTALLAGCASTTVTLTPPSQAPVCNSAASALVLWAPQWRPDQKDASQREAVAHAGLQDFLSESQCFARSELRRLPDLAPETIATQFDPAASQFDSVVLISVRELGPVIRLLSFPAFVDGATEVVLYVTTYQAPAFAVSREFSVHWRNGGPGVVKGVSSLPDDLKAALRVGLQPAPRTR